ncbi:ribosome small subunit-dependent GTPase A [Amphibacillus sp. MSJ-3]|uniref:ribosome small subunit-dependent GTPase A n=1 Tax=Amphibacillus sp. MSJ-3 TaxID=2841505 RepID=UPI001C0F182A|nr:ribosome small subunit-dependent GTPase A [Amphibacillus sp. MSJ-3]MBU5594604.1 ribosome small subunit-dependent GTPase A [Amphibacillus sp. MSJ-3]
MPEGQIIKALSGFYYVLSDGITYQCKGRGLFRKKKQTPLVGDKVIFEAANLTDGYVIDLLPRKNELIRPPVANIDQALITVSAKEPQFSTKLLDRFLVLVEFHQIEPIILITKMDLVKEDEQEIINDYVKSYQKLGYRVKLLSNRWEPNLALFTDLLKDKISVIAGQSGVGKSSFLNLLNPALALEIGEISSSLGRGKHTTRHVELIEVLGGMVADTPGFSSLDFDQIELNHLPFCFREINQYRDQCKFRGCMHINEPQCAVKDALENKEIKEYRYQHYLDFYQEIKSRKPRY